MLTQEQRDLYATHEVTNQPPPLVDFNLFDTDAALVDALRREGAAWGEAEAREFGAVCGSGRVYELGFLANTYKPELRTHDRYGHRVDRVDYHPAYHELMALGIGARIHSLPWVDERPGSHVLRAVKEFMLYQIEAGVGCPITMTFAVVPALRHQPDVAAEWLPRVLSDRYDPRFIPASEKAGATIGMAMTEKQGGSDVRANTTRAVPINGGGPGTAYELTGHKWFCSAPMCDAFLTLAYTEGGLSCFLVPRFLPDGTQNRFFIQRLKDKLGNRSNASSEIEYHGTWAVMVGEEGRGVPTIIDMVSHTRLDCAVSCAGLMRQAVAQAAHHARHRKAFGKFLKDQPLMKNVLADLIVESEAATAVTMRLARSYDDDRQSPANRAFTRIATAIIKYFVCKRVPHHVYECLECHGGAGYVEESIMPRLYREAPLASIWEGSGNVMCLDVLRAMQREPDTLPALLHELEGAKGADKRLDRAIERIHAELAVRDDLETRARRLVEQLALTLEGAQLVRHGHPAVADAFCASRLERKKGEEYGTLPRGTAFDAIIERATPNVG